MRRITGISLLSRCTPSGARTIPEQACAARMEPSNAIEPLYVGGHRSRDTRVRVDQLC